MTKYKVTLENEEREELMAITRKGSHNSQKVVNALILLNCDEGEYQDRRMKNEEVVSVLKISMRKIDRVKIPMEEPACVIEYEPRSEFEALKRIAREHEDDPWMARCRARMAELKAAKDAEEVSLLEPTNR